MCILPGVYSSQWTLNVTLLDFKNLYNVENIENGDDDQEYMYCNECAEPLYGGEM